MTIYLYVKQHSITGLKYFGKTTRNNPHSYLGSGKYWLRHIKKHGKEFINTIELWKFEDEIEASNFALTYSNQNNIVESLDWANLIHENGLDGAPKGIKFSEDHKKKMRGRVRSAEHCKKLSENHTRPNLGKTFSEETRKKMSENNVGFIGRKHTEESKEKTRQSLLGKKKNRTNHVCPHCGLQGSGPNMIRYHYDKCKLISHRSSS